MNKIEYSAILGILRSIEEEVSKLMQICSESEDMQLRRLVGRLASEVVAQMRMDIRPYVASLNSSAPDA